MKKKSFGIYIPSYKRSDTITTHKWLEYYKVVVRKSEEEDYEKVIPKENIIAVEDKEINSLEKVLNWINENSKEDIICVLGDDVNYFQYRLDTNKKIEDKDLIIGEIERIAQLLDDLNVGYACITATGVPWGYDQEIAFKGTSGGMFWINKEKFKSKNDEEIGYCMDTNIVLNELLLNRIVLVPKYLTMVAGTDTNKGGNSGKTRDSMVTSFELMKKKWGKYFDYDLKTNKIFIRVKR